MDATYFEHNKSMYNNESNESRCIFDSLQYNGNAVTDVFTSS